MTTISKAMARARQRLTDTGYEAGDVQRIVSLLMQHLLGTGSTGLISRANSDLSGKELAEFEALVLRAANEPVHRILGWREFYGLKLALSPAVLEPRDDTGTVIELVLTHIGDRQRKLRFADLGTGGGAIALALLSQLPNATAVGTDIDARALETAMQNAMANGLSGRFETAQGNWFDAVSEPFDFIVSNPPYIASGIIETLDPSVRDHDPHTALDGGPDGLDAYRTILAGAALFLEPEGFLALEIGHDQAGAVSALALAESFTTTSVHMDLSGNNRALLISR